MLDIPDETLLALKMSPKGMGEALRMAGAVKLFELGQLSSQGQPRGWQASPEWYFSASLPITA
jgi:hypothetical protein